MADTKISALTAVAGAARSMLIPVVEDPSGTPVTKKMTVSQLLSLDSGSHSSSSPLLDMAQTWNAGGTTFTALKFNIAATAAAADSLLLDIQVGGTSKFKVRHDGLATATGLRVDAGSASAPSVAVGAADTGIYNGSGQLAFTQSGTIKAYFDLSGRLQFPNLTDLVFQGDLLIGRDAANVMCIRSSTAAQSLRVYNTYTDGSNYERGVFDWGTTSNVLTIGTQKAGTGSTRTISIIVGGAEAANIDAVGTASFAASIYSGGDVRVHQNGLLYWNTKSILASPSDGVLKLTDYAGTSFNRIQFGGTTSSFPAIKRDGAGLKFVVADDSASADIECLSLKTGAPNGGTAAKWKGGVLVTAAVTPDTTRYIELDVAGTLYKVIVST